MEGGREGGGTCVCVCVCVWSGVEGRSEGLKEGRRSEGVTVGFSARRSYFVIRDLVIGMQVQREGGREGGRREGGRRGGVSFYS